MRKIFRGAGPLGMTLRIFTVVAAAGALAASALGQNTYLAKQPAAAANHGTPAASRKNGWQSRGTLPPAGRLRAANRLDAPGADEPTGDGSTGYVQPDFRDRFQSFAGNMFSPTNTVRVVFGAAISQADNVPPDWGQGWGSYGERLASHFGASLVGGGANLAMAQALGLDTKYYPCTCRGIWPRLRHALVSSVTARAGTDGHRVFSPPAIASPYAGAFTSLSWYPPRFGPQDGFRTGNYDLLDNIAATVAEEFLHPLLQKLHRK